ncbi:MAG: AI-2E family transporter [Microcella sp.]|uniref:AI-2E family transporter n=1 Tax=Microcella sp. TaxID=1913979 RepID=UPI0024C9D438|nr:AI-2E family transporter [Microcella sp.]UYN84984.1 MAG: AI-2E family transporter [Microcella sp.]
MIFRRRRSSHDTPLAEPVTTLRGLWVDRLGRLSIRSLQIMLVLALASLVVLSLVALRVVVIPLLLAIIIASAFSPVVMWMRRRGLPAMAAAWITLLGSLLVLGGIITAIVFAVRRQWSDLWQQAQSGFDQLLDWVQSLPFDVDEFDVESLRDDLIAFVTSAEFGSGALSGAVAVGEFVAGVLIFVVVLFFLLKDGDHIWQFMLRPFRGVRRARGERIGTTAVTTLGGYIRGTSIVALVDAVAIGLALVILQVPLALPLAVIVFIAAFIPLVGATVAGTLAALVALVANGPLIALIVVIVVIAVNQLEGDLLQPVVMAKTMKLHPLAVLLALSAGTILGGVIGAILSVPIAATAWAIVKTWDDPANAPPARS